MAFVPCTPCRSPGGVDGISSSEPSPASSHSISASLQHSRQDCFDKALAITTSNHSNIIKTDIRPACMTLWHRTAHLPQFPFPLPALAGRSAAVDCSPAPAVAELRSLLDPGQVRRLGERPRGPIAPCPAGGAWKGSSSKPEGTGCGLTARSAWPLLPAPRRPTARDPRVLTGQVFAHCTTQCN
jgi:hypothetical protein